MNSNQNNNPKFQTISGYVRALDRDKSGHVIQVALETDDMERYIVDNNTAGNELIKFIDKRVLVMGTIISQDYIDEKLIIITKFNSSNNS